MTLKERYEHVFRNMVSERCKETSKIHEKVEAIRATFPRSTIVEYCFYGNEPYCSIIFKVLPELPPFPIEVHVFPNHIRFRNPQNICADFENLEHFIDELAKQVASHGREL